MNGGSRDSIHNGDTLVFLQSSELDAAAVNSQVGSSQSNSSIDSSPIESQDQVRKNQQKESKQSSFSSYSMKLSDNEDSMSPGSDNHKAERWQQYQERGGEWNYERWSNVYESNMSKAREAHKAVDDYHKTLGWGKREQTVDTVVDGEVHARRLDIADIGDLRGIEFKTGYQTANQANLWEIRRDASLVDSGWDIEWFFAEQPSKPLIESLESAGINYRIGV